MNHIQKWSLQLSPCRKFLSNQIDNQRNSALTIRYFDKSFLRYVQQLLSAKSSNTQMLPTSNPPSSMQLHVKCDSPRPEVRGPGSVDSGPWVLSLHDIQIISNLPELEFTLKSMYQPSHNVLKKFVFMQGAILPKRKELDAYNLHLYSRHISLYAHRLWYIHHD